MGRIQAVKNRNKIKVVFRADGGPQLGMGHIMRCLALAKAIQDAALEQMPGHAARGENVEIMFITAQNSAVSRLIAENGYKVIGIQRSNPVGEIAKVKEILEKHDTNIVITDSYSVDRDYLEQIGCAADLVVSIDDLNQIIFTSDLVINGNVYATGMDYQSGSSDTEFLLGTDYVLLRDEFVQKGDRTLKREVNNVLVSVGGSDPLNLTPKIVQALDEVPGDFETKVIIGPGFQNLKKIAEFAGKVRNPVELLHNVKNMAALMMSSDLAVTAGGTTLYELSCTGTPAVVLLQADNQVTAAAEMAQKGALINLGMGHNVSISKLSSIITEICTDWEKRWEMSKKGPALVDGYGCRRCAHKILQKYQTKKEWSFDAS
ncbi:UDP-2 [Peptococcaceae bacterium DYL19]|nr:UDP-2 [Phosphitispora fastidiosa]